MMDIRELLILVLALLILFSLLRAVYVIHRRGKGQIRLAIDNSVIDEAELDGAEFAELPNGGARRAATAKTERSIPEQPAAAAEDPLAGLAGEGENVPILLDPVAATPAGADARVKAEAGPRTPEPKAPGKRAGNWKEEILKTGAEGRETSAFEMDIGAVSMTAGERIGGASPKRSESPPSAVAPRSEPEPESAPREQSSQRSSAPPPDDFTAEKAEREAETKAENNAAEINADRIITINVIAGEDREFNGRELWDFLHTAGLRLDKMKIFSKTEGDREDGKPIFRVANIVNPGIFDADAINDFSTPGIGMFMLLPAPINNMLAFEQMLAVARRLAEALDGRLLDCGRRELTARGIEQARRRIREFDTGTTDSSSVGNGN